MDSTTLPLTLQLRRDMPFAFSVQALLDRLQTLTDQRKPRGVRYPLDALLLIAVLARPHPEAAVGANRNSAVGQDGLEVVHHTPPSLVYHTQFSPCVLYLG